MWQHLRENKQTFQWYKIYCQQTLLQQRNNWPKTSFLTLCAKFTFRVLGSNLAFCRTALFWTESSDVVLGICRSHSSSFGVIAANAPDYWSQLIFGGHLLRLWVWHPLISALPLSIAQWWSTCLTFWRYLTCWHSGIFIIFSFALWDT